MAGYRGGTSRHRGFAEAYRLTDRLSDSARDEAEKLLRDIAREELAAQKAAVAKDTGRLERALGIKELVDQLKVQIGLLGTESNSRSAGKAIIAQLMADPGRTPTAPRNLGDAFYGIIVEKGRKAQNKQIAATAFKRAYSMKVSALPARPYVYRRGSSLEQKHAGRLAEFWSNVLKRTGAAA